MGFNKGSTFRPYTKRGTYWNCSLIGDPTKGRERDNTILPILSRSSPSLSVRTSVPLLFERGPSGRTDGHVLQLALEPVLTLIVRPITLHETTFTVMVDE